MTTHINLDKHIPGITNVSTYNIDRYKSNNRYDGGTEADDIPSDIPLRQLQEVAINYYKTKVVVTTAQTKVIELTTAQHT